MLTTFSQQTDEQYFLNNNPNQNETKQYDADVFEPLEKILKQTQARKFIVVHLLGTHIDYKFSYPKEFDKFSDRNSVPNWIQDQQLELYNAYDNAVLYNDLIVSSLIKQLSASQANGFMLYMSDHGEEVFDTPNKNFNGRDEGRPTQARYTIPFILWTSKQWQASNLRDYQPLLNRSYSTSYFINTWADLAGMQFDEFDSSKSLINKDFKSRERLIGDPNARNMLTKFDALDQNKTTK